MKTRPKSSSDRRQRPSSMSCEIIIPMKLQWGLDRQRRKGHNIWCCNCIHLHIKTKYWVFPAQYENLWQKMSVLDFIWTHCMYVVSDIFLEIFQYLRVMFRRHLSKAHMTKHRGVFGTWMMGEEVRHSLWDQSQQAGCSSAGQLGHGVKGLVLKPPAPALPVTGSHCSAAQFPYSSHSWGWRSKTS